MEIKDINLLEKKLCYKCGLLLPITQFKRNKDWCCECNKRDVNRQPSKKSLLPEITTFNELGGRI